MTDTLSPFFCASSVPPYVQSRTLPQESEPDVQVFKITSFLSPLQATPLISHQQRFNDNLVCLGHTFRKKFSVSEVLIWETTQTI